MTTGSDLTTSIQEPHGFVHNRSQIKLNSGVAHSIWRFQDRKGGASALEKDSRANDREAVRLLQ